MHSFKLPLNCFRLIVTPVRTGTHITRCFLIEMQRTAHHGIILFLNIQMIPREFRTMRSPDEALFSFLIDIWRIPEPAQHDRRNLFIFF